MRFIHILSGKVPITSKKYEMKGALFLEKIIQSKEELW